MGLFTLLSLLGTALSAEGSQEEQQAVEAYNEKMASYERQLQAIEDENRAKAEKRARKQAMASAVGYNIPMMPTMSTPRSAAGEKPLYEKSDEATSLQNWGKYLGTAGQILGSLPSGAESYSTIPIIGGGVRAYQSSQTPSTQYGAPDWMGSLNPEWKPQTFDYTSRYEPSKRLYS